MLIYLSICTFFALLVLLYAYFVEREVYISSVIGSILLYVPLLNIVLLVVFIADVYDDNRAIFDKSLIKRK